MRSCSSNLRPATGLSRSVHRLSSATRIARVDFCSPYHPTLLPKDSKIQKNGHGLRGYLVGHRLRGYLVQPRSMAEVAFDDWGMDEGPTDYVVSSSDGEDSDGEILLTPINDVDMPAVKKQFITSEDALTATAHRLALLGRRRKKYRIAYGFVTNMGLITFLILLLAFVDWCAWRIVRLPLEPFCFIRPFMISGILVACAGYISVPLLKNFNMCKRIEKHVPVRRSKKSTPTMGGLFFVPIGVGVAKFMAGFSSIEVSGAAAATLALAAVGLLDDVLVLIKNYNFGLSNRTRFFLEVAVAVWFSFWLDSSDISSPYGMYIFLH